MSQLVATQIKGIVVSVDQIPNERISFPGWVKAHILSPWSSTFPCTCSSRLHFFFWHDYYHASRSCVFVFVQLRTIRCTAILYIRIGQKMLSLRTLGSTTSTTLINQTGYFAFRWRKQLFVQWMLSLVSHVPLAFLSVRWIRVSLLYLHRRNLYFP